MGDFSRNNYERYIYKLIEGDSIVVHKNCSQLYMVLAGVLNISKVFTNQEVYAINIISDGNFFMPSFSNCYANNYYYALQAVQTTYIVSLTNNKLHEFNLMEQYNRKAVIYNSCHLTEILIHKNTQYRLIHLLLLLSKSFGIVHSHKVVIPLQLSYNTLGIMIGSNGSSVGKILRILHKNHIAKHSRNWINIYSLKELILFKKSEI